MNKIEIICRVAVNLLSAIAVEVYLEMSVVYLL
jgi:hypothetical protein